MEAQLKQRIIGASVLVGAAIVFVPMILRGPPPEAAETQARDGVAGASAVGSETTSANFSSRIVPVPPTLSTNTPSRTGLASATRPANASTERRFSGAATSPGSAVRSASSAPGSRLETTTASDGVSVAARGWAIQLGAFSDASNAFALRDRLKAKGYSAFAEAETKNDARVTRVLVGPSPTRERAHTQLERLREATSLGGFLVRYPKE